VSEKTKISKQISFNTRRTKWTLIHQISLSCSSMEVFSVITVEERVARKTTKKKKGALK